ncbi:MAG: hypothetical protein JXR66_13265 [Bacteroidales bacterium]|nr:hypothetical protein [Bacteroidales bacterium]
MKAKFSPFTRLFSVFCILHFAFNIYKCEAQIPQGFNYQAVARDATGTSLLNTALPVRITFQTDSLGGTILWQELHQDVVSNNLGIISLIPGKGARQAASTLASFSDIDWSVSPKFIKTEIDYGGWKTMGISRLWSVPYSLVAENLAGSVTKLTVTGETDSMEESLFEVKNKSGQTVFAVYNEGVRIYVSDGDAKGLKGGFAVGGFGTDKAESTKYMFVGKDSVRFWLDSNTLTKGLKGGFAVGGYDLTKGTIQNYLEVNDDNTTVFVNDNPDKGVKGGFAVGGFDATKAETPVFMNITRQNYFIGHESGLNLSTGMFNSILGFQSGRNITEGASNAFLGYQSGFMNSTGNSNLFLGYQAGYNNTTGSFNSFAGYKAGYNNTTGESNSFFGSYSGTSNTTGSQNTFIGFWAGYLNSIGDYNNFIGYQAGYNNTEGSNNVFLGTNAGYSNTSGKYNIYLGYMSGYSSLDAAGNTFLGYKAGESNANGGYNVFIGNLAGNKNTASNNTFIGNESGRLNTTGSYNAFMGYQAGQSNINGAWNVFLGNEAGKSNTSGCSNVFIGNLAGEKNQSPPDNVFIGYLAGQNHTSGANNIFIGSRAGMNDASGGGNVFLGYRAGEANSTGYSNVFISTGVGYINSTGYMNVLIGDLAGVNNTTGNQNVIIGREAGISNSTGNRNVMIGYQAGNGETGSNRLHIGQGSLIYGEMDNDMVRINGDFEVINSSTFKVYKNGNVGVGMSPSYKFDVAGNRIRLNETVTGDWIAMRTDGGSDDYLDLSFGGGSLVIQGNTANENIIINPSMNRVGIKTWEPQYDLDVDGSIRATASVYYGGTDGAADGTAYSKPDYVFGNDYPLLSVEEVKDFLDRKKHLPWVTSAEKEKEENGNTVDMTRMAFETLETIENLQLQIIMMNDKMLEMEKIITAQQKEINKLNRKSE